MQLGYYLALKKKKISLFYNTRIHPENTHQSQKDNHPMKKPVIDRVQNAVVTGEKQEDYRFKVLVGMISNSGGIPHSIGPTPRGGATGN